MRYYVCDNFVISNDPDLSDEELIGVTMNLLTKQGRVSQVAFTILECHGKYYACGTPFPMNLSQGMIDAMIKHLEEEGIELDDYELREITDSSDFTPLGDILTKVKSALGLQDSEKEDYSDSLSLDDEEEEQFSSIAEESPDLTGGVVKRKANPSASPLGQSHVSEKQSIAKRELKNPFYKKFPHYIETLQQARKLGFATFRVFEYDGYYYLVTSDLTKETACEFEFIRTKNYVSFLAEHGELVCSGWQDFEGIDLQEIL